MIVGGILAAAVVGGGIYWLAVGMGRPVPAEPVASVTSDAKTEPVAKIETAPPAIIAAASPAVPPAATPQRAPQSGIEHMPPKRTTYSKNPYAAWNEVSVDPLASEELRSQIALEVVDMREKELAVTARLLNLDGPDAAEKQLVILDLPEDRKEFADVIAQEAEIRGIIAARRAQKAETSASPKP
jgi:hypothetical protein